MCSSMWPWDMLPPARSESQGEEVDAQEQKNEERDCAYQDDCAASFAKVGVWCLKATILDPPANRHHRDSVFEEDKANETGEAEIVSPEHPQFGKTLTYINWAGKFIPGGITDMRAAGDRYRVYRRPER